MALSFIAALHGESGAAAVDTQPPSVPAGLVATGVTATEFTLNWQPSSDNVKVTAYDVFKDGKSTGTVAVTTKPFAALAPATHFAMSVRARDAKGNWSALSPVLDVATLPDTTAPTVPAGVSADDIKLKSLTLRWAAASDNVRVTGYEVLRDGASLGTTTGRAKNVTGLSPGTAYHFTVRAFDAAGNYSPASEPLRARTLSDLTPPSTPANVRVSAKAMNGFLLRWNASKDDTEVIGYEVFRDGVSIGGSPLPIFIVVGLAPNTTYAMAVRARDLAGNWSPRSEPLSARTAPDQLRPTTPSGVTASAIGAKGFRLSWNPSSDNVGVTGYEVQCGTASFGTAPEPNRTVTGLVPATTYAAKVRARDAAGNWSAWSTALKVKTLAKASLPSAPTGLASSAVTAGDFTLQWQASAGADAGTVYEIFQNGISAGMTSATSFHLSNLSPGAVYRVAVRAGDGDGHWSEASAAIAVTYLGLPFISGFEADEGYGLGALGELSGWTGSTDAQVIAAPIHRGAQALSFPAADPARSFSRIFSSAAPAVTFADVFARPASGTAPADGIFFETPSTSVALVKEAGLGRIRAFDGDGRGGGEWRRAGKGIALDADGRATDWLRLTVRTDPAAQRWDLYLDGQMAAADLGFRDDGQAALSDVTFVGSRHGDSVFDDVLVGFDNPLFADADRDGMDDAWEREHGLDPAIDDRQGTSDATSTTNLQRFLQSEAPDAEAGDEGDQQELLDSDGDGLTDEAERSAGTNPLDYYNGRALVVDTELRAERWSYSYDRSGRLVKVAEGDGAGMAFDYDAASNLTALRAVDERPFASWRSAQGLPVDGQGADDAIVAGDGLKNFAKYALGLEARTALTKDMPLVGVLALAGQRYLTLTYQRPAMAPADVAYVVEVSADGVTWHSGPAATVDVATSADGPLATVLVRDVTPIPEPPSFRRIRLKLERKE